MGVLCSHETCTLTDDDVYWLATGALTQAGTANGSSRVHLLADHVHNSPLSFVYSSGFALKHRNISARALSTRSTP